MLSRNNRTENMHARIILRIMYITMILFLFKTMSAGFVFAAQVKVNLTPSNDSRVEGHKLYYGKTTSLNNTIDLYKKTETLVPNLQENTTYYFAATAYDKYGNESKLSSIISYHVPKPNEAPTSSGVFFSEDFENYSTGHSPSDWFDTRANNSMLENNNLFKVFKIGGNNVFGTNSDLVNIHSHRITSYIDNVSSFEYSGRMMRTNNNGGVGVTFLSHYPFSDGYYRLRCTRNYSSFHIAPHPHEDAYILGKADSGVVPDANTWYRFRIKVKDTGHRIEILAKIWPQNSSEPSKWQIDAYDNSSDRMNSGTFGVWSGHPGHKYWDDLKVVIE